MPSVNRSQVRIPRRLWDEMQIALEQSADEAQAFGERNVVKTRQVVAFARRILAEARRREREQAEQEEEKAEASGRLASMKP